MAINLETLLQRIDEFGASITTKLAQLNTAYTSASEAGDALDLALEDIHDVSKLKNIYVDSVLGNDDNTGLSAILAVKTWKRAMALVESSRRNILHIMQDLNIDANVVMSSPPSLLELRGIEADGSGYERRVLTIMDDPDKPTWAGGIWAFAPMSLSVYQLDVVMAYESNRNPFTYPNGGLNFKGTLGTITRTGGGAPLFRVFGNAHYQVSSIVIDPTASGSVVFGVASGGDPNDLNGTSANFTQA